MPKDESRPRWPRFVKKFVRRKSGNDDRGAEHSVEKTDAERASVLSHSRDLLQHGLAPASAYEHSQGADMAPACTLEHSAGPAATVSLSPLATEAQSQSQTLAASTSAITAQMLIVQQSEDIRTASRLSPTIEDPETVVTALQEKSAGTTPDRGRSQNRPDLATVRARSFGNPPPGFLRPSRPPQIQRYHSSSDCSSLRPGLPPAIAQASMHRQVSFEGSTKGQLGSKFSDWTTSAEDESPETNSLPSTRRPSVAIIGSRSPSQPRPPQRPIMPRQWPFSSYSSSAAHHGDTEAGNGSNESSGSRGTSLLSFPIPVNWIPGSTIDSTTSSEPRQTTVWTQTPPLEAEERLLSAEPRELTALTSRPGHGEVVTPKGNQAFPFPFAHLQEQTNKAPAAQSGSLPSTVTPFKFSPAATRFAGNTDRGRELSSVGKYTTSTSLLEDPKGPARSLDEPRSVGSLPSEIQRRLRQSRRGQVLDDTATASANAVQELKQEIQRQQVESAEWRRQEGGFVDRPEYKNRWSEPKRLSC